MNDLQSIREQIKETIQLITNTKKIFEENNENESIINFLIAQDNMLLENLKTEEKNILLKYFHEKFPYPFTTPEDIIPNIYPNNYLGPIDPKKIAEQLNIKIESDYNMIDGIGRSEFNGENIVITYKPTNKYRDKFTIAHELGHIFLHFTKGISYCFVDKLEENSSEMCESYYSQTFLHAARLSNEYDNKELEQEANKFAEELLVPKSIIEKMTKNVPKGKLVNASLLKDFFQVSNDVIFYALSHYEMLNNGTIVNNLNQNRKW